ncbi:hypothetical protein JX265_000596 [Neoarthrinium moseri]|uniref:Chromo domain-containing protein n=1 Tax=Neoarthrinium moseri TaxID=1658444 RepID=A0A9P9WZE6_9PEZI|nr:uncharacterized protein JN550_001650 [Neoarthrinium moseri]KAI1876154.1 hypothetical protein JN550_001650 [Neoarthrinium moseri]KAI1881770.1 hypothetical protein JX265_000596 [Neoarthrinium moseri]
MSSPWESFSQTEILPLGSDPLDNLLNDGFEGNDNEEVDAHQESTTEEDSDEDLQPKVGSAKKFDKVKAASVSVQRGPDRDQLPEPESSKKSKKSKATDRSKPKVESKKDKMRRTVVRMDSLGESDDDGNDFFQGNVGGDLGTPKALKAASKKRGRLSIADDGDEVDTPKKKKHRGRLSLKNKAAEDPKPEDAVLQSGRRGRGRPSKSAQKTTDSANVPVTEASTPAKRKKQKRSTTAEISETAVENATPSRPVRAAAESAKAGILATNKPQRYAEEPPTSAQGKRGISRRVSNNGRGRKKFVYDVEKLVDSKVEDDGRKLYHVKWINYPDSENTWEPLEHLKGCLDLVQAFDAAELKKSPQKSPKKGRKVKGRKAKV